jgi:TatD DNase family protein
VSLIVDYEGLAEDLPAVLKRCEDAGVGLVLSISSRIRKFDRILAIAERYENVFCTVGTHPHNAHEELDIPVSEIVRLTKHPKVVGIGEAGLDYHYQHSTPQAQAQGFRNHIAAARETGLPLVIHTREAEEDTARILEEEMCKGAFKAVLHCFTSQQWLAEKGVDLGLYVSFSGILTYKTAQNLRDAAKVLPEDRFWRRSRCAENPTSLRLWRIHLACLQRRAGFRRITWLRSHRRISSGCLTRCKCLRTSRLRHEDHHSRLWIVGGCAACWWRLGSV